MNQALLQVLQQVYGNNYPHELDNFLVALDQQFTQLTNLLHFKDENLRSCSSELTSITNQLSQEAESQRSLLHNIKSAIAALEPNSQALNNQTTYEDDGAYLTDSLMKLIEAQKIAEKSLKNRNEELSRVNIELENEKSQIKQSQAKDQAVLYAIGDGLVVTDKNLNIVMVNQAFGSMMQWTGSEVIGKHIYEIMYMEEGKKGRVTFEESLYHQVISDGKPHSSDLDKTYVYKRKDQISFPVKVTVAPIILNNEFIGLVEVFTDITKEKEVENAKTEFVSLASHQLRTPLSSINWYTEMLMDEVDTLPEDMKPYIKEIEVANKRMIDLVNALLNVSRIELGTFMTEPEKMDIRTIPQAAIHESKQQVEKKALRIIETYTDDLPEIISDPKILRIIFDNLITNAIKYTPDNGEIEITINKYNDDELIVSVRDTGYGIPQTQQTKVFSKLFRGDNIKKKDTDGNGLGLYMIKQILNHIGGKIWFVSEEDKGSTFFFTLPVKSMIKQEGVKLLD